MTVPTAYVGGADERTARGCVHPDVLAPCSSITLASIGSPAYRDTIVGPVVDGSSAAPTPRAPASLLPAPLRPKIDPGRIFPVAGLAAG